MLPLTRAARCDGPRMAARSSDENFMDTESNPMFPALSPRIAFFSPLPPMRSGISDYSIWLLEELKNHYAIDLYHDSGYVPHLGESWYEFGCYDYRLFESRASMTCYRGLIYQMGNSHYHKFVYDTLLRHSGIVTLHDFCLADFHTWYASLPGAPADHLRCELERSHPERAAALRPLLDKGTGDRDLLVEACLELGVHLNRRIFERAKGVIVHDPWCLKQISTLLPEYVGRTRIIPHGANVRELPSDLRTVVRARFRLPEDALIFGCFGALHPLKMNAETVRAFAQVAKANRLALLLFVGDEAGGAAALAATNELGLAERVRFLGRVSIEEFVDLSAAVDVGISLRRPSSNGETSGALLILLGAGIPTIVLDTGTFASYPDDTVYKIGWGDDGIDRLTQAMQDLAGAPQKRIQLGRDAQSHLRRAHNWHRVAGLYRDMVEHCRTGTVRHDAWNGSARVVA